MTTEKLEENKNKHYIVIDPPEVGEPLINLNVLFSVLHKGKFLILILAIIMGGLMAVRAYYASPKYEVSASLLIKNLGSSSLGPLKNQYGGLAAMAGIDLGGGGGGKEQEYYALLSSKKMVREFLERKKLLTVLFAGDWNRATNKWKPNIKKEPNYNMATKHFLNNIMFFSKDRKTGIISISIKWREPVVAQEWLSSYISFANETLRVEAIDLAEKTIVYLEDQAKLTQLQGTKTIVFNLMESQINEIMMAKLQNDFAFKVIDPPIVPEVEDYIRPRPLLEIIAGLIFGAGLAVALISIRNRKSIFNI